MIFDVPGREAGGTVKIVVYNLAGERVAEIEETGATRPAWTTRDVAPGLYLVRIFVNGTCRETLKIAVVR